jgi:type I restriction enzyme R subunit
VEYPVTGMPNPRGGGFVDYVLWGDDGKPLGLVEAKRTSLDPHEGQRQAELYANCLEEMHCQRPIIFYTNGYETWIWDDQMYPERQVQGLYTKQELMRLIQRRRMRKDFRDVPTNKNIVDRYYQENAIRSLCEHLSLGHRRGLLVMATGTGKTRVSIALVDVLMRAGWVKRVLFLADRTALVNQAVNAFKRHLPESSPVNLLDEKEAAEGRVVVSTYHTMMNLINATEDNNRKRYSVGHFDLVIIDEAHRSVYDKFGAIFEYFDSLLLGLTATPKNEVDRNTYRLFHLPDGDPVFHYELDQAVADGFLTPFKAYSVPLKFQREGIRYRDLSDEEKAEWDQLEWSDDEPPDYIDPGSLNAWLFNADTVDKVLETLMLKGIKVKGGDRLGKTIIFCKNHKHAQFVQSRFDLHYPEYRGKFARVIDNYERYAQTLIDDFSVVEKLPHIAISIDMLDTGIDIPEVVNLVFFKLVRSKTKFWQMIGRGTRLCPDLLGPGLDKEHFLIFDYCMNFEFFDENPDGYEAPPQEPLSQRLFKRRLDLLEMVSTQGDDPEQARLKENLIQMLHGRVQAMNTSNFIVAAKRRYVDRFGQREPWENLSQADFADLSRHISGLPTTLPNEEESALQFDLMMLNLQAAFIEKTTEFKTLASRVMKIADELKGKSAIPMVQENMETIKECQEPDYWENVGLESIENIRQSLRHLIRFLDRKSQWVVYTDFQDEQGELREITGRYDAAGVDLQQYRRRIEQFIRQHQDHQVIRKIRYAMPLDSTDLEKLEEFFYEAGEISDRDEFHKAFPTATSLPEFIRSLVGMDREAAKEAFSRYLDDKNFTADQIRFINYIIDHLTSRGTFEKRLLYEPPFTYLNSQGIDGMFKDEGIIEGILRVIERINASVRYAG